MEINKDLLESIYTELSLKAQANIAENGFPDPDEFNSEIDLDDLFQFLLTIMEAFVKWSDNPSAIHLMYISFLVGLEAGRRESFAADFSDLLE